MKRLSLSKLTDSLTWFAFVLICIGNSQFVVADEQDAKAELDFFEAKIRPVLVRECYSCHSQEAATSGKLRGGLLLDTREATLKGGDSGPAVVAKQPAESLLISALKHESYEMPPKGKLPDAVIADFEKWVENGAVDPRTGAAEVQKRSIDVEEGRKFWSFLPLAQAAAPNCVDSGKWSRTSIDRFILAELEPKQLLPNPTADARTLIRRAWFDLLGLPPTPTEMQTWLERLTATSSGQPNQGGINSEAWLGLIDELLNSPHYGERQARHWMDVARFAESHGYEQDYDRPTAYYYRDFLIQAFNNDLPYDQFVQWQLAGDEIAPQEPLAWMATGFLGAGAFPTQLTETEFESARYDELDDMVGTTGVAFLGLSIACARCHDHKFDPIPSADYYRMAATFATVIRSEKQFDLTPEENAKRREQHATQVAKLREELTQYEQEKLPVAFIQWLQAQQDRADATATWKQFAGELTSAGKSSFLLQPDGAYLSSGEAPDKDTITVRAKLDKTTIGSIRIEALTDKSLPNKGPGRAPNGNFALGDIRFKVLASDSKAEQLLKFSSAKATHQQNADSLSVAASIDADPVSGWAVDGQIGKDQAAVFTLEQPLVIEQPTEVELTLGFNHPNPRHAMGRFRVSVAAARDLEPSVGNVGPSPDVASAVDALQITMKASSNQADPAQLVSTLQRDLAKPWAIGLTWFKTQDSRYRELNTEFTKLETQGPKVELATVLVTSEGLPHLSHHADGRGFPHFYPDVYQLRRGDVNQKVDVVQPGSLQVLTGIGKQINDWKLPIESPNEKASYRRSTLARWITDTQQGGGVLAARVMVNRLWQHHFGRGIVPTPNDFGASGELPTHPQLLDYLATRLIDNRWQLKQLHREIMTSSVYMQSSKLDVTDDRLKIDPENKFYWRRVPLRLEAEAIRDTMLSVSGQLDETMFGPGTLSSDMRRRSVYFFIKRSQLIPMMMLFDWPEHLVSIGQRPSTTIAPQALMFMNSPEGRAYARALAKRLSNDQATAISDLYWITLGRMPTEDELRIATDFLGSQAQLRSSSQAADSPVISPEATQLALADLCQVVMSMNEFVYVD